MAGSNEYAGDCRWKTHPRSGALFPADLANLPVALLAGKVVATEHGN